LKFLRPPALPCALILAALVFAPLAKGAQINTDQSDASSIVEDSIVKVFSTMRFPDIAKPWSKQAPQDATGSGVIIGGHYILTNAHVVEYATQVEVQGNQAGDKISASVIALAPGIDLALLKLDDDSFFAKRQPLECGPGIPSVKDTVMTYGFPTGGSNLSITKGIISRIEFTNYRAPISGLRIQIDAAINPGNSGGAAVVGTKLIGITFSSLVGSGIQNIGYIIPCEEIDLFLRQVTHGQSYSKPGMFDELQTLENPALRNYLKLDRSVEGIVVHTAVGRDSPLQEWDIISRIGDTRIDNQGMVNLPSGLRVRFQYLIQKLARDGKVTLTIERKGKSMTIALPVSDPHLLLIPDLNGTYPRYFVYGPLVFSVATQQFIGAYSNRLGLSFYLASPLATRIGDTPAYEGEELVVVAAPFLPHRLAKDYSNPAGEVVKSINGVPVKNLAHLVQLLRDSKDEFIVIDFQQRGAESIVFPRQDMQAATEELLTDNGIRAQGSADTLAIWSAH
jgi:S1-C subfamily serine protease